MKMINVEPSSGTLGSRAVVLTADKFEDMELFVPYFRLLDAGGAPPPVGAERAPVRPGLSRRTTPLW